MRKPLPFWTSGSSTSAVERAWHVTRVAPSQPSDLLLRETITVVMRSSSPAVLFSLELQVQLRVAGVRSIIRAVVRLGQAAAGYAYSLGIRLDSRLARSQALTLARLRERGTVTRGSVSRSQRHGEVLNAPDE